MAKLIKAQSPREKRYPMEPAYRVSRLGKGYWIIKHKGRLSRRKVLREVREGKPYTYVRIGGQDIHVID